MKQYVQFQCSGEDAEILPESLVRQAGVSFRDAQSKAGAMAAVAKVLKQERGDVLAQVPFCVSIEAEALGAPVTIYDNPMPPSLGTYPCNSLEDALSLPDIDFSEGRIREVLQAVHLLAAQGEKVSLRVEGPFTVLAMLMSVTEICRIFCRDSMALLPVVDKLAAENASAPRGWGLSYPLFWGAFWGRRFMNSALMDLPWSCKGQSRCSGKGSCTFADEPHSCCSRTALWRPCPQGSVRRAMERLFWQPPGIPGYGSSGMDACNRRRKISALR